MLSRVPLLGPATPPSLTATSVADHDTVALVLANLDFDDPQAVSQAHERLTQAPALTTLCNWAFDGVDQTSVLKALATLYLRTRAADTGGNPASIPGNPEHAHETLAARLSPAGSAEVRRPDEANAGPNAFSPYLAHADRLRLAGHAWFAQGQAHARSAASESALHAWGQAVQAFESAKQYEWGATAHKHIGDTYALAGDVPRATQAWLSAAALFTAAGLHEVAARYCTSAGRALATAGHYEPGAAALTLAADAWKRAAQALTLAGEASAAWREAAAAGRLAAQMYTMTQPGLAAAIYAEAAEANVRAGEYLQAAKDWQSAAAAYKAAKQYEQAAEACTAAAVAYALAELPAKAEDTWRAVADAWKTTADAWKTGAEALLQVKLRAPAARASLNAAVACRKAAEACRLAGKHSEAVTFCTHAAKCCSRASDIYMQIGQTELAADACETAAETCETAAQILTEGGNGKQATDTRRIAEERYRLAAAVFDRVNQHERARQAEARADAVWGPVMTAFREQAPDTTAMITDINTVIAAQLPDPDKEGRFSVDGVEFQTDCGDDILGAHKFNVSEGREWCGLRIGTFTVGLITRDTAIRLIREHGNHPYLGRPLEIGDFLRGQGLRDLLQPGWRATRSNA